MKQKMVIKVCMDDEKSRSKALKIAVSRSGILSAALTGDDKRQIEVIGNEVDAVRLTVLLRKNVGHADLVSVADVPEKKPDDQKKPDQPLVVWPYNYYYDGATSRYYYPYPI